LLHPFAGTFNQQQAKTRLQLAGFQTQ